MGDDGKVPTPDPSSVPIRVTDRRPRFDDTAAGPPSLAEPEPRYPGLVVELQERTRAAEAKLAEALNLLRRREAEADEFRARLRREMERRLRTEMETHLRETLEVLDSLDRGVASAAIETGATSLRDGMAKVREQFLNALARQGVEPMSLVGTAYDPNLAEAVALCPASSLDEDDRIVEELRRGYMLGGQVLRAAQVRVARRAAGEVNEPDEDSGLPDSS